MNVNELIKDVEIKKNTIKMYENTLEQMKKMGASDASIEKIEAEKKIVESELIQMFRNDDKEENVKENSEEKKIDDTEKFKDWVEFYNSKDNRVDEDPVTEDDIFDDNEAEYTYYKSKDINSKVVKTINDVNEEVSKAAWVANRNFIVRFPLNLGIDEWRVSHLDLTYSSKYCSGVSNGSTNIPGQLNICINDFIKELPNGKKFVLAKKINSLLKDVKGGGFVGDIDVEVIDGQGEVQYIARYKDCKLVSAQPNSFSYASNDLHSWLLEFKFHDEEIID